MRLDPSFLCTYTLLKTCLLLELGIAYVMMPEGTPASQPAFQVCVGAAHFYNCTHPEFQCLCVWRHFTAHVSMS